MNAVIKVENFSKIFGSLVAVDNISFEVGKGEMFGLVGPDGAGKTTTVKTLCGLLSPSEGSVKLFEKDVSENLSSVQKRIGYLSQRFTLYEDLSVDENIEFFAEIHDVKNFHNRREELLEFTRLKNFRNRLAENLSGGMKQKLSLACSLIHDPEILFLDEPTTGVDPVSRRDFWKILASLLNKGITIFMTTPYLDEAERCNRVALMNKGKIMMLDEPDRIKESIGKVILEVVLNSSIRAKDFINRSLGLKAQSFGDRVDVVINNDAEKDLIVEKLKENGFEILSHRTKLPSLENVFIHLIEKTAGN